MNSMIIELQDICKDYIQGTMVTPVLRNINFTMKEGEYTAIMGPSGSGKSTLMNLIGCLDQPTSGRYLLDGEDVSAYTDNQMSDIRLEKIGFVFQTFQLLPYMSAADNVALPLSYAGVPRKERRERAIEMLGKVGLSDRVAYLPNQLSGGQKQRVAIARAMINQPRILLADEPTGALDSTSGKQIMGLFRELNEDGVTILMITHDAEIASNADRIVEIRDGLLNQEVKIQ
jgi:putative ABC transport system ATP-binding protein